MNFRFDKKFVAKRLEGLREDKKETRASFGEIAGSEAKHDQAKIAFYNWFLNDNIVDKYFKGLHNIARHCEVPIDYFFGLKEIDPLKKIEKELHSLGLEEKYIEAKIKEIEIMSEKK